MSEKTTFGDRLRLARGDRSLNEAAVLTGFSKGYLSLLENNHREPTIGALFKISQGLGFRLQWLFAEPDDLFRVTDCSPSLKEFGKFMEGMDKPLSISDQKDLASIHFRGRQPTTVTGWLRLYLSLDLGVF